MSRSIFDCLIDRVREGDLKKIERTNKMVKTDEPAAPFRSVLGITDVNNVTIRNWRAVNARVTPTTVKVTHEPAVQFECVLNISISHVINVPDLHLLQLFHFPGILIRLLYSYANHAAK